MNKSKKWSAVVSAVARSAMNLFYGGGMVLLLAAGFAPRAEAGTYTWDTGGDTTNMSDRLNWDIGGSDPADITFLTAGTHDLVFGTAGSLATPTNAAESTYANKFSVRGIRFTRAFQIWKADAGKYISIGTGGVTMDDTVGGQVLVNGQFYLTADTVLQNNSANDFKCLRGFDAASARSITNNGTGANWVILTPGAVGLGANVTLIQDSLTSKVSLEFTTTLAGKVQIRKGLFSWLRQGNPTAGDLVLGSTTAAATDWAKIGYNHKGLASGFSANAVTTNSNPIVLVGTVGTNTIASGTNTTAGGASCNHTMCYTGGVTGANSLYLENIVDSKGDDGIRFQTGSINMTNKLIHIGVGGGTCTVDSVIGPNVTEVIQNSGTSPLVLGGANTYTGNTTVLAGTLAINNLNALQKSTLDTGASGSQRVTFTVADNNTYNVGGLTGSDVVDVGGNTLSVGASGALAPGSAGVGTLTVTGAVTLVEGAVYQWQCASGVGDLLELKGASGTLTLPAVATVQVSQISGDLPSTPTLFTATALGGPGASGLSGWTVSGLANYIVSIQGTSVILSQAGQAPAITAQPTNLTVDAGQTATFNVTATGTEPLSYQWYKTNAAIGGATASSYTTPATTLSDSGTTFKVTVSNVLGVVTSDVATLTVSAQAPAITAQPTNLTVYVGRTATFSVTATGTALSYQWYRNNAAIGGATSSSYITPATTLSDNGTTFKVTVSNMVDMVTSDVATLTVTPYIWDAGGGSDTNMSTSANWVGDPVVNFLTGGTETLSFGTAGSLAQPSAGYSVRGITFTRGFTIGSVESGSAISIGTDGVTMDNTVDGKVLLNWGLDLTTNTFIANNSTNDFVTRRGFGATSARSITNNGSGTNWVRLYGGGEGLDKNVTLVQDSLTSKVVLEAYPGPLAGKLEIRKGLVTWNYPFSPTTNNIVLGSTTALATDWAKLGFNLITNAYVLGVQNQVVTNSNPIVLAGTVGTNTIASGTNTVLSGGNGYLTLCYTGGVTGANSLYLENMPDSKGDDNLRFQTGSINMTNKLIHIGAGSGTCTVDSVIGPNVTEVIQNSGTSPLILGGANTYTGNTTVLAGTLAINNVDALQKSTLDTGTAGSQRVTLTVAGNNTYHVGGLTGSDVLDVGGNTLSVGASGALAPGSAGVGTLTVTGAVTLVEGTVYQWEYQDGVGDSLELKGASGTLALPAVATVQVSHISGVLPSPATLFTATALSGPGATDLSGWTVSGLAGYTVYRQGTSVILNTNTPPVAQDQSVSAAMNADETITLVATDADGDALSYAIVDNPTNGTLGAVSGSNVVYTPATEYIGGDSFTFRANDGRTNSNVATVTIEVTGNHNPTVTVSGSPTNGVVPLTVDFIATGADVDSDPLTYSWAFGDSSSGSGNNVSHDYTNAGTFLATVTVSDGKGGEASTNVTITVWAPPTITTPPANATVIEGQSATFSVAAAGTAPLAYQWFSNGVAIAGATATNYTTAATRLADTGAGFAVTVTNAYGAVTSGVATLTVKPAGIYTWDAGGGSDTNMSNTANWDTGVGDPPDATFLTVGTNSLIFGTAGSLAQPNAATYSVNGITFTRAFQIGSVESGSAISIGGGGLTMNSTVDGQVLWNNGLNLNANTFIANNSTQDFATTRGFEATSARSITNNGSGTNWVRLTGGNGLNNKVTLVQDSLTSKVVLEQFPSALAGKLEIRKGLVTWNYPFSPTTNNIVLGSTTALATDWAKLGFNLTTNAYGLGVQNQVLTNSNPIVLVGTAGTNTIASGTNTTFGGVSFPGYLTLCYTGGVTGANSLYLENMPDSKGDDNLLFQTGSINMTNKLIHIGAGGGTCTVDSVIGPNVTEVIQNSGTSPLVLGGANTYTGNTTVLAGTLAINNVDALQKSTLDTGTAGSQRVTFTVVGNNTYHVGGLTGSDVLDVGGNTLSVGASGALAPGSAGVGTLTVTGAVTLVEGAVYQWQCESGVGDLLDLKGASGTLTLPAVATVQVSQISGALPIPATLFTATALSGPGAADLSGWTVSGLDGYMVRRQETSVIIDSTRGTIFRFR